MNGRLLVAALACAALVVPATAFAKGASQATVEGKGIDGGAIAFKGGSGGGAPPGSDLERLAQGTGFYPAVFGQQPNPMEPGRPEGDLGPRYTISWVMPGPGDEYTIRQDLYPYAAGGALTYTAPRQRLFEGMRTKGGWFRVYDDAKTMLVEAGLPSTAPAPGVGGGTDVPWPALTGGSVLALALAAMGWFVLRRRPHAVAPR